MSLAILEIGAKILEKLIPDPAARAEQQLKLFELEQHGDLAEMQGDIQIILARAGIIKSEAESQSWLTSNWRPILMLTFGALIVARWLGWAAPNITESEMLKLWDIVQLGLGGYVIGRSVEQIVKTAVPVLKR